MSKFTTDVAVALTAAVAAACNLESMGWPQYESGGGVSTVPATTYEAEWVGYYEGTGKVEVPGTGETLVDLPICFEARTEGTQLVGVVFVQLFPPPDFLMESSDGGYSKSEDGLCAGSGVTWTLVRSVQHVTSKRELWLRRPDDMQALDGRSQGLVVRRYGDDLEGLLRVAEPTVSSYYGTYNSSWKQLLSLTFSLTKVE